MRDRITVRSDIHFGKPCVAGTRIPVQQVLETMSEPACSTPSIWLRWKMSIWRGRHEVPHSTSSKSRLFVPALMVQTRSGGGRAAILQGNLQVTAPVGPGPLLGRHGRLDHHLVGPRGGHGAREGPVRTELELLGEEGRFSGAA